MNLSTVLIKKEVLVVKISSHDNRRSSKNIKFNKEEGRHNKAIGLCYKKENLQRNENE